MGCSPCQVAASEHEPTQRLRSRLDVPVSGLSERRKGLAPTKQLKLRQSNYVVVCNARLSDLYEIQAKAGEGSDYHLGGFGHVYKAVHRKLNQVRAIKSLDRRRLPKAQRKKLLYEVDLLKEMVPCTQDHPNILKIYEVIKDERYYHIVTELLTGGELFDRITQGVRYSERQIAEYMMQILSAVYYCHQKRIIHRDIKPENLIFENPSEGAMLKVIDFGASCVYEEGASGVVGTAYYIAPEVLKSRGYDEKCDVWSCGIILYMLLCGYPPFNAPTEAKIQHLILNEAVTFPEEEWGQISVEAIDLVSWMLAKDPRQRPSAWELFSHGWFQCQSTTDSPRTNRALSVSVLTRLKDFRAGSQIRQAALHLITSQFTDTSKYEELRNVFLALDTNKDGKLSREELMCGYKLLKLGNVEEVDRIMEICDTDHNGYLDYTEFLTATLSWEHLETETLDAAFSAFDKDGDGSISAKELKFLLEDVDDQMDEAVWEQLLQEGDSDKDGSVRPR